MSMSVNENPRAYRFVVSVPSADEGAATSALNADPDAKVRRVRGKRGIAEAVGSLVAVAPLLLEVTANSLTCIEYLATFARTLPKRRAAECRIMIGDSSFVLSTTDPAIVKEAISEFCRGVKQSAGRKRK